MNTLILITATVLALPIWTQAAEPVYDVRMQLYRLSSSPKGKMEAASASVTNLDAAGQASDFGKFSVFTAADLKVGDATLHMDGKGVTWNGAPQPAGGLAKHVECLSRPTVRVMPGQSAEVTSTQKFSVPYMDQRSDGLFVQKSQECEGGVTIGCTTTQNTDGSLRVAPIKIKIVSWNGKRQAVEGVPLDIGKPVLETISTSMSVTCQPNQPVGVLWTPMSEGVPLASKQGFPAVNQKVPADDGALLVILSITVVANQPKAQP